MLSYLSRSIKSCKTKFYNRISVKKSYICAFLSSLFYSVNSFALGNTTSISNNGGGSVGTVTNVWGNNGYAAQYLQYAMYAAIVVGVTALGFLLFNQGNETIMKGATRTLAVCAVLALAFSVPTWFNLSI